MNYTITLRLDQIASKTFEIDTEEDIYEHLMEMIKSNDRQILQNMVAKTYQIGIEANIFRENEHLGEKYILLEGNKSSICDLEYDEDED